MMAAPPTMAVALQDPIVVNSIQSILTWILLQTTSHRSWARFVNVGGLVAWMFWIYRPQNLLSGADYEANVLYRTLQGCIPPGLVMRTAAALVLLESPGQDKDRGSKGSNPLDLPTASRLTIDPRAVGTPWQVKRIPSFPTYYASHPPTRGQFMLRQAAIALWQCLCFDLVFSLFLAWTGQKSYPAQPRELSVEYLPPGPWVSSTISMLVIALIGQLSFDISYRVTSIVHVGLGMSTGNFPPLFGSVWDAYSLQRFWGKCWHQFLRLPFTTTSSAITRQVLCLSHSSILERYLNIALVFALSGLMHFLGALSANIPYPGAMHFFGLSGLGVLIEITFQGLFYRFVARGQSATPTWYKIVGFLWVGLWFSLVAPWYSPEWEYLFTVGSSDVSFLGAFTNALGAPVAGLLVGLYGLVVRTAFKTSI